MTINMAALPVKIKSTWEILDLENFLIEKVFISRKRKLHSTIIPLEKVSYDVA